MEKETTWVRYWRWFILVYGILSLGLIPFLAIHYNSQNTSIDLLAVIILIIMAMICLVPFVFFVRGKNCKSSK